MVVHHVEIVLHGHGGGGPLGDELHDLLHHVVGEVLGQEVKHEAVGGLEVQVLQVPGVDLSQEDGPAKTINIIDQNPSLFVFAKYYY